MNEKTNRYFRKMYRKMQACERGEQHASPFTCGQCKAFRAWQHSFEIDLPDLEMDDDLWEWEMEDFTRTLAEAGIRFFVLTNLSRRLLDDIRRLEQAGWRMTGASRQKAKTIRCGEEVMEDHLGMGFEIKKGV